MPEQDVAVLGRHRRRSEELRDLLPAVGRVGGDVVAREQVGHAVERGGEKIGGPAANTRRRYPFEDAAAFILKYLPGAGGSLACVDGKPCRECRRRLGRTKPVARK